MATYTIELRKIIDIYGENEVMSWFTQYDINHFLLPSQLEALNSYQIFSKEKLAKQIINHYFMREIGFETPMLFKHYAIVTMNEIMEEKLPLIYTICLDYDPLTNVDFLETFTRTGSSSSSANGTNNSTGNNNSNSNSNSSGISVNSNTPQRTNK